MTDKEQKRSKVHAWVDQLSDDEVDIFYQDLVEEEQTQYQQALLTELDRRWARHISGESASYTLEELHQKLDILRKKKYQSEIQKIEKE